MTTLAILIALFIFSQPVQASEIAASSAVLKNSLPEADTRVEKLTEFLKAYGSPLAPYAQQFVDSADKYRLDWKLVPAITGVESTFGKQIPAGSYNAYGWANGVYYFQSWEQSIELVSKTLKEKYAERGLDTPAKMGPVYAPPSKTWAGKVVYFMNLIECFGEKGCFEELDLTL